MTHKNVYRMACVGLSVLLLLLALTVYNTVQLRRYQSRLEASYLHALQEISAQMNAINVDLKKYGYAASPAQISAISAQIWRSAGAAKAALGTLPLEELELEDTYRFLSQVGEYSMYLSRKSMRGEEITQEERDSFENLRQYAVALNDQISDMVYLISEGRLDWAQLFEGDDKLELVSGGAVAVSTDFNGLDQHLEGYPTLIYDGPFSDHLLQHSPAMLEGETVVQPDKARKVAADFADCSPGALEQGSDESSHMPSYSFTDGTVEVGVTKQGGHVAYLVNGRDIDTPTLSIQEALEAGRTYLELRGIGAMKETYYELYGGVLTINYAYTQPLAQDGLPRQIADVTCYTDLIKVGVAVDNGQIVFYDARGFINNHKDRNFPELSLSVEEAAQLLSPALVPQQVQTALVPSAGGKEALSYEFLCKDTDGGNVLVYINTATGAEEQILILLESDNGTLTV